MKSLNLWKTLSATAILLAISVPNAMAGGTNRGENTSAEPGDKATTTREATDPSHNRRKGTTHTNKMRTPTSPADTGSGSSGSSSSGSSSSGSSSSGSVSNDQETNAGQNSGNDPATPPNSNSMP